MWWEQSNDRPLVLGICLFSNPLWGACNWCSPNRSEGSRVLIQLLQVIFGEVRDCFFFPFNVVVNIFLERFFTRLLWQKSSDVAREIWIRCGHHDSKRWDWGQLTQSTTCLNTKCRKNRRVRRRLRLTPSQRHTSFPNKRAARSQPHKWTQGEFKLV